MKRFKKLIASLGKDIAKREKEYREKPWNQAIHEEQNYNDMTRKIIK